MARVAKPYPYRGWWVTECLKLKAIPEYADKEIISRITNIGLTPASYSEI